MNTMKPVLTLIPCTILLFTSSLIGANPQAVCKDATIAVDAQGQAVLQPSDVDAGSTVPVDHILKVSPNTFDCSSVGTPQMVRLFVEDQFGVEQSFCTAMVTVEDNTPPVLNCQSTFTAQLDVNGLAVATPFFLVNFPVTDNCGAVSNPVTGTTFFDCDDAGQQRTVVFSVDDNAGNTGTCNVVVNIIDVIPPTVQCKDITVTVGQSGTVTVDPADVEDVVSTDNCGIGSKSLVPNAFTCNDAGINVATLTVTDANGNASTCQTNLNVVCNTLPITLEKVEAFARGEHVVIEWTTASEVDNDYFTVEHSADAIDFSPIKTVDGKGNTTQLQQYRFEHDYPYPGTNYYRIRQTDFDGRFSFSPVLQVNVGGEEGNLLLYPNPITDQLNIRVPASLESNYHLTVFNQFGQAVYEGKLSPLISTQEWPSGMYWLKISDGRQSWKQAILKQ